MTTELRTLPVKELHESPLNPRQHYDAASLADLTASIAANGVLNPLLVRPVNGSHEIVAGHRRRRAAIAAGLTDVPVTVRTLDDTQALELMVIDNLQRQDVHPLEEALGYRTLMDRARYEVEAIAAKVGKSLTYIHQRLALLRLIDPARKAFLADEITPAHAVRLARLQQADQPAALEACFDRYVGGPTKGRRLAAPVHELARWIDSHCHLDLHAAPFKKSDETLVPEAGACQACTKRTGANPALFADVAKGDTCTDPTCYQKKVRAHLDRTIEELKAAGTPYVLIAQGSYYSAGQKKVLPPGTLVPGDYREAGKKTCPHTVQAVVVDNGRNQIGSTRKVCTLGRKCDVHAESWERRSPSQDRYAAENRAKQKAAALETAIRRAIVGAAVEATMKLDDDGLRAAAVGMARRVEHDDWKPIFPMLGWELPTKKSGCFDYRAEAQKHLAAAAAPELSKFFTAATLMPDATVNSYSGTDPKGKAAVLAAAARLKVDGKAIERRLRAEAEAKAKKTKKLAAGKKAPKPSRKPGKAKRG